MDFFGHKFLVLLAGLELVQLLFFWFYIRRRYGRSLRQLGRATRQLAEGQRPRSYYIDGPAPLEEVARDLEQIGTHMEGLRRQLQADDFNLNALLANMVEGVMVVDQRHVVRLVNHELLSLFNLRQSPINRTVLESLRESQVEMIVRETIQSGKPGKHEVTLEKASAAARYFDVNAVPIRPKKGEIVGAVVVFHDITRIKQLEVLRSEFVANVSHELRTPLSIFRGYLETFKEHPDLSNEDSQRMLDAMRRHSNRLNALVEDLLMLTRFEARQIEIEFTEIRVVPFFRQLIQDWGKKTDTGAVEIDLQMPEELPPLEVDVLRFEQVLLNLMENGVAYSNPPRRIVIGAVLDGDHIVFRIGDNGIGIPPGDLPNIFERFYRVDKGRSRASGGTGLGLSIVKEIIEAHHGTVHAESEIGKGTSVVLRLPLRQEHLDG